MKLRVSHPSKRGYAIVKVNPADSIVAVQLVGDEMLTELPAKYSSRSAFPRMYAWSVVYQELKSAGFVAEPVAEDTDALTAEPATNEKVALFCRLYKHFKGTKYSMNGKDVGMLKCISIDEPLLNFYFDESKLPDNAATWLWKGKQSVRNLCTFYNEVRAQMVTPTSKHPNHWVPEHAKKLDGEGMTEYVRHLKSLGLVPKKHADGSTMDWVKPS